MRKGVNNKMTWGFFYGGSLREHEHRENCGQTEENVVFREGPGGPFLVSSKGLMSKNEDKLFLKGSRKQIIGAVQK